MDKTKQEIIDFIAQKNIKLIHIVFCHVLGKPKIITIAVYKFQKINLAHNRLSAKIHIPIFKNIFCSLFLKGNLFFA